VDGIAWSDYRKFDSFNVPIPSVSRFEPYIDWGESKVIGVGLPRAAGIVLPRSQDCRPFPEDIGAIGAALKIIRPRIDVVFSTSDSQEHISVSFCIFSVTGYETQSELRD
jgi:hypothetical protein